jgi:hypothetical protein
VLGDAREGAPPLQYEGVVRCALVVRQLGSLEWQEEGEAAGVKPGLEGQAGGNA